MTADGMIQGDRFVCAADIVYSWRKQPPLREGAFLRRLRAFGGEPVVVYADGHDADRLNRALAKAPGSCVVLLTHNSDACVRKEGLRPFDADFGLKAACVRLWFAQNIDVDDDALRPLPIGLERPHLFPREVKMDLLAERRTRPFSRRHLLYINHSVATNAPEREAPYRLFEGRPFALTRRGRNGVDYRQYLDDLASSFFCVSPPGNGIDCHRTWEALYLGCVPIVKRSILTEKLYRDLPVLQVESYETLSQSTLEESSPRYPQGAFLGAALGTGHYLGQIRGVLESLGRRRAMEERGDSWAKRLKARIGWSRA